MLMASIGNLMLTHSCLLLNQDSVNPVRGTLFKEHVKYVVSVSIIWYRLKSLKIANTVT